MIRKAMGVALCGSFLVFAPQVAIATPTPNPNHGSSTAASAVKDPQGYPAVALAACGPAGTLCIQDYETKTNRTIQDNNNVWANFGWGSRADWFFNNKAANACVYSANYAGGTRRLIQPGTSLVWRNVVNSNRFYC